MPRVRDEDLLEGRCSGRYDPTGGEAIGAAFQIIWSAALVVFWLLVALGAALWTFLRWIFRRPAPRRITPETDEFAPSRTEEKPDVWRYGY